MLRVDFVSLFPELILPALGHSILLRAKEAGQVAFRCANPRDFAEDAHRTVDHPPFGGGAGMVLMAPLVAKAVRSLDPVDGAAVILTDPSGERFCQRHARELASRPQVVFLCGHYGGVDDRVRQRYATQVFSIGDFVLTGGELPALVMADAVVRLIPGVLGDPESLVNEAHTEGLLGYPQFTKPRGFEGASVPDVLLSGDHGAIARWRRRQALLATRRLRPDLFATAPLTRNDLKLLDEPILDVSPEAEDTD
ncbi:MAG TPA: tRNA (guanosine(37)-N1)-methyltransferase TrmD [Fimbriimonadaceae bacterium]|nr:tRNA (guanosine(37)-N1)-methyltransferase TrmD [Fimbriimonadaceae bacterium]